MTWTDVVTQIDNAMVLTTTGGYIKQSENKDLENNDSSNVFLNKGYSLKAIDSNYFQTTGLSAIATYGVELKVSYIALTEAEHQSAIDSFHSLLKLFTNKNPFTNFAGFIDNPIIQYDDGDKSLVLGIIKMYYGFKGI